MTKKFLALTMVLVLAAGAGAMFARDEQVALCVSGENLSTTGVSNKLVEEVK